MRQQDLSRELSTYGLRGTAMDENDELGKARFASSARPRENSRDAGSRSEDRMDKESRVSLSYRITERVCRAIARRVGRVKLMERGARRQRRFDSDGIGAGNETRVIPVNRLGSIFFTGQSIPPSRIATDDFRLDNRNIPVDSRRDNAEFPAHSALSTLIPRAINCSERAQTALKSRWEIDSKAKAGILLCFRLLSFNGRRKL